MISYYKYSDKEVKELAKSMVIIVDSREKENKHILDYFNGKNIAYRVEKLDDGDYSFLIPANPELGIPRDLYFTDEIKVERKASLEEVSGNLTNDRLRIESEFIRSKGKMILLIENASYEDIMAHNYKTEYNPMSFLASLHSFNERYNLNMTFIKDNKSTGQFIYFSFYYFLRNLLLNK